MVFADLSVIVRPQCITSMFRLTSTICFRGADNQINFELRSAKLARNSPGNDDVQCLTIPQFGIPKTIRHKYSPQLRQALFGLISLVLG
jgi:hypothetical protein